VIGSGNAHARGKSNGGRGTSHRLEIVIVAFRAQELLRRCLESVLEHAPADTPVHVVDNNSGDGTAEMVGAEFPSVHLDPSDRNLGFGAANNRVLRDLEAGYVLVLNPDTQLTGSIQPLLDVMSSRPEVGICGARLEREDGTLDHASKRAFPTPLSALGHFTGFGRRGRSSGALAAYRAPEVTSGPVDAVNGAFMLIRREALDEVGYFDERYWMYMEDLDLCYRFAAAGWMTWYEPAVKVIHVKAGTTGGSRSPRLQTAFHYGMFRFYRDHYAGGRFRVLNGAVYAGIGLKLGVSCARSATESLARAPRPS